MRNQGKRVAAPAFVFGLVLSTGLYGVGSSASEKPGIDGLSRVAIGPVTYIDTETGTVEILGQRFRMTPGTRELGWDLSAGPAIGDYVLSVGLQTDQGIATAKIAKLAQQYVPGASPVFLRAEISRVATGFASISDSSVALDMTSARTPTHFDNRGGSAVLDVFGVQPQFGDRILATAVSDEASSRLGFSAYGALLEISASDLELLSISGSDYTALTIAGAELAALFDYQPISIPVGGLLSITGSDSANLSITGSDRAQWSITGSDRASLSITGSDRSQLSITGSDSANLSITGSDRARLSITGSDFR